MGKAARGRPPEKDAHVILDNRRMRKRRGGWLASRPNFAFHRFACHFAPGSASWLGMLGIWLGGMSGNSLKGPGFSSKAGRAAR
jgi:hypothetical protein